MWLGAPEGWFLLPPRPPLSRAARWCSPGSGLRRGGARRCQCRGARFSPAPVPGAAPAMEPHRWLPLEANPDVSTRLRRAAAGCAGGLPACLPACTAAGGREEGWRRGEGRRGEGSGPLRPQRGGLRDGWWGQGTGEVLARGSNWGPLLSFQVTNQVSSF